MEKDTVRKQLVMDLDTVSRDDALNIIIAYEPIWAIGTGKTATSHQANEMSSYIREVLGEIFANEDAQNMIIQYGGSLKASNALEILSQSDIDGALVGGASLKADEFIKIVNYGK